MSKWVVKCYLPDDRQWMSVSDIISKEEATRVWERLTGDGQHHSEFSRYTHYFRLIRVPSKLDLTHAWE